MRKILFIYIILFFGSNSLQAQSFIRGTVLDAENLSPIKGAIIQITGQNVFTTTDTLGNFKFISKVQVQGSIYLEIHLEGYNARLIKINPVKSSSIDILLEPLQKNINEVIITGVPDSTPFKKTPYSITIFKEQDIREGSSTNVINALAQVPGVSGISDGQSISKPVIRGLGYSRILTLTNGIPLIDQAWFDEFGIEADPDAVNKYEIIKGPASLSYGSDALGGVINLISSPRQPEGSFIQETGFEFQSNNGLLNSMIHLAGTEKGISWDARGDNIQAHSYQNKLDGYVINTQFHNYNLEGRLGIYKDWGHIEFQSSYFNLSTGIVDGTRDSASGQLERSVSYPQVNDGVPFYIIPSIQEIRSYTPFLINQSISHLQVSTHNEFNLGRSKLNFQFSWQKNLRKEANNATQPNVYDIFYASNGLTYSLRYNSPEVQGISLSAGVNGVYQNSKSLGTILLIPNYHFLENGVFASLQENIGGLNLIAGIRYNTRKFSGSDQWVDSLNQAPALPNSPDSFHEFTGYTSNFSGLAYSIGSTYTFENQFFLKANLARGWRAPNVVESGANGVHDGTVVYEIGNPHLLPESSLEEDFSFGYKNSEFQFEINLFNNNIDKFINAQGLKSQNGGDSINNSLNAAGFGQAPVYKYTQNSAQLFGGEGTLRLRPKFLSRWELNSGISYVFGQIIHQPDSSKFLPFVPPTKLTNELRYNFKPIGNIIKGFYIKLASLTAFEQKNIYQQYAVYTGINSKNTPQQYAASKSASQGYTLISLGIGSHVYRKGKVWGELYFQCTNLMNTAYIDYMSRFKYYPVNYATGRVGVYNMGRNLSFKFIKPLNF